MRDQIFGLAALDPVGDVGLAQASASPGSARGRASSTPASSPTIRERRRASSEDGRRAWRRARAGRWRGATTSRASSAKVRVSTRSPITLSAVLCAMLARRKLGVEPFERPVELLRSRPGEGGARAVIVVPKFEQTVARLAEGQRLGRRAGRGEGGERHGAIVTPLDGAGNGVQAASRAAGCNLRANARCNKRQ